MEFWNHSKQHSSKTPWPQVIIKVSFGTIRNNTALKRYIFSVLNFSSFGTIRNNTALKRYMFRVLNFSSFGTIRNNTALKQLSLTLGSS